MLINYIDDAAENLELSFARFVNIYNQFALQSRYIDPENGGKYAIRVTKKQLDDHSFLEAITHMAYSIFDVKRETTQDQIYKILQCPYDDIIEIYFSTNNTTTIPPITYKDLNVKYDDIYMILVYIFIVNIVVYSANDYISESAVSALFVVHNFIKDDQLKKLKNRFDAITKAYSTLINKIEVYIIDGEIMQELSIKVSFCS